MINITPEMLSFVAEIDEFKGRWHAYEHLAPDRLTDMRRVATIESVGSSTRIEGVTLCNGKIADLLSGVQPPSLSTRDEQEVAGYADVMNLIFDCYPELTLTENHIKQLHQQLLAHGEKDARHRGRYKTIDGTIEAFDATGRSLGVIFQPASSFDTPRLMEELVKETQEGLEEGLWHPLIIIGCFVVRFLAIHPFQDGNGRLSRVLTTLLLLRSGYAHVPYCSLEKIIEESKESYYRALHGTQSTLHTSNPAWSPWLLFFLRALKQQKERLKRKVEEEVELLSALPKLASQTLALVRDRGQVQNQEISEALDASRNSVKVQLAHLVEKGLLERHGKGRGTWYTSA